MLNRRRLLFAGVATLPGVVLATSAKARKPKPKPKPKWKWKWETVTRTFSSNQLITIPHEGIATPYPAKIQVSGMRQGRIRKVTVSLSGLTHTWPRDLDIMLADPKGRGVILMNDAGGENEININLTFDDAAPAQVPEEPETLLSGKYRPTTYAADDGEFPPPAPEGSRGTSLAVFNNSNPNGAWSLYVFDDSDTEDGSIAGWSLKITAQARVRVKPKPKRQR